ncbi:50S ribosomal protein L25 [Candidatus Gottesmanbacteria bacterium]|nr:50S ribosomal protein L25 [Candidatus Gottesmanbacteria bacterium]
MKKHTLLANPRTLVGRKVKQLRKQGLIPATMYGKNIKSVSVSLSAHEFDKVYKETGETGLIELTMNTDTHPVLIHHVQVDPVGEHILHIEFHQVDLKEKVTTRVPVKLMGTSPVVMQKLGVLLAVLDEIEVEALPADLPEYISIDTSGLHEVNAEVKVGDVTTPKGVSVQTDPSLTVVKIGALITKEAQAQAQAEATAAAAAKTTEAPGAPTTEEAPSTEKPTPEDL